LPPDRFWEITLREAEAEMDAANWRFNEAAIKDHNDRAWLAYHVAALQKIDGKKVKFPSLASMMISSNKKQVKRTWQESHAEAIAWSMKGKQ
jgi:hypothetical protein